MWALSCMYVERESEYAHMYIHIEIRIYVGLAVLVMRWGNVDVDALY
jgi:hypothetical protein